MKLVCILLSLFTLLFLGAESFGAGLSKKKILISVGDLKEETDSIWKKHMCSQVYTIANQIVENGADVTCRNADTTRFQDPELTRLFPQFNYHMRILRNADDSVSIEVTKLQRIHRTDFKTLGWNFKDGEKSKVTKEEAIAKAVGNFFYYVDNEEAFKAGLLVNGVQESNEIEYDQEKGIFKNQLTGEPISINKAYSLFEGEGERKQNYLRTGVEIGVLLSSGMAIYYKNISSNQADFDYGLVDGIKKKLNGEAFRFDDNSKKANYGHVYAGVLYYQEARANGFNSLESFLVSFASSTAWEFMEYREVLSINDEILTPIGGYVIGEATYQISCALLQKDNLAAKALGYTINPGLAANQAIDKFKSGDKYKGQLDCKKPRWEDISVYIGLDKGQKAYDPSVHQNKLVGMDATVVNIEDFQKPGKESKLVYDTAMAKMLVEINGNDGVKDLRVIAQIVAAAFNQKNLSIDESGQLRGYNVILGAGSASTWNDRGTAERTKAEDFYGTIDILGASAHADIYYNGFKIKADFGFYGDFTMVKSYSLSKFLEGNPTGLTGQDTTLQKRGYYYGMGTTVLGALAIQKGNFEIGYNGQSSQAKSINGHHRYEEQITRHDNFNDSLDTHRAYISYQLTKNLKIQLTREYNIRTGSINGDYHTNGVEKRTMGTLVYKF